VGEDAGRAGRRGVDRLTIQDAARRLGVSEGAVRKRLSRGTLPHDKGDDGRVYVYLDAGVDEGVDPNTSALISQLKEEVSYLREENRRKDEIIMQQAMTVRQLTALEGQRRDDAPESPESPGPSRHFLPSPAKSVRRPQSSSRGAAGGLGGLGEPRRGRPGTMPTYRPRRALLILPRRGLLFLGGAHKPHDVEEGGPARSAPYPPAMNPR
jgi:hypothetical protein